MATSKHPLTPFLDIESAEFAEQYELGVWCSMYGEEQGTGLVAASYLVINLNQCAQRDYFGKHDPFYLHHIGFLLGMYHGGILSPQTGKLRSEVTMLAHLDHESAIRGYHAGRVYCFVDAAPHEQRWSESKLIARLRESVGEMAAYHDADDTWFFEVGCVLGELSTQCFPMSAQEQQVYAAHYHEQHTEPLPVAAEQVA